MTQQEKEIKNTTLEEVAEEWAENEAYEKSDAEFEMAYKGFIAGAKWKKEQMLKDTVEGEVCGRVYDHINVRFADGVSKYLEPKNISHIPADISKYAVGDKVKIIIVPEKED